MAYTPLLKKLNSNGTTFYTFSSAAKDLSKCMSNSKKEFTFSHFVCINIPDFINQANYDHASGIGKNNSSSNPNPIDRNYFQFSGIYDSSKIDYDDSTITQKKVKTSSKKLADQLQGYVFNFEEKLISDSEDNETDRSVAERIFWHWLKEVGAMNLKFDESKIAPELVREKKIRFVEGVADDQEIPNTYEYENIVKYIGSIDITNNVDIAQEAYTEIYIHIPTEAGCTPTILFEECFDGNFESGGEYRITENEKYIIGHTEDEVTPLDIRAMYDEEHDGTDKYYKVAENIEYGTQPETLLYTEGKTGYSPNLYKTDIDGMCIDFNANSYNDIVSNNISNMSEFNKIGTSFEFNAVLVYYDIVDVSTKERTSNLYGILFLDDVKTDTWDYFQRYPKYKPVSGVQNGNSYGFRLNLRIDIEPSKNGITTMVNEYNTFSMSLFSDAMAKMKDCASSFSKVQSRMTGLENRLTDVETLMSMITNYESLSSKIDDIQKSVENANLAFADRSTLLDLIANVSDKLDSLMKGKANIQLQYNTDVVKSGYGTEIDTSVPNSIKVNNSYCGYSICNGMKSNGDSITEENKLDISEETDIYVSLKQMSNLVRIHTENNAKSNINIHIDSKLVNWKTGQNIKIVFQNMTIDELQVHDVIITDDNNGMSHTVSYTDFIGDRPIIELICMDSVSNEFVHDVLR